jgi:hypothetical protein
VIVHSGTSPPYRIEVIGGDGSPVPLTSNFVLEVNYAYLDQRGRNQQQYFLVDVVNFSCLSDFFAALNQEIEAAQFFLSAH